MADEGSTIHHVSTTVDCHHCNHNDGKKRRERRQQAECSRSATSFGASVPWLRRRVSGKFRQPPGQISMTEGDEDLLRRVRRNKLLGMWAAEKLGLSGESAEAYSSDLAMGTFEF